MRIHTDRLKASDLYSAALIARVDLTLTEHRSRSRARGFNVTLRGESNRKPNYGTSRTADRFNTYEHAATWDQWGVFLAVLFEADANRTFEPSRDMFTPYDESYLHFAARTGDRFGAPEDTMEAGGYVRRFVAYGWPEDAHGDHSFKWDSGRREYTCRRCSAVQRYDLAPYLDQSA